MGELIAADGTLFHRYRDGEAAIAGLLDDYAHFSRGLCDLFMVTGETRYLSRALALARQILGLFGNPNTAVAYICRGGVCSPPISDLEILKTQLQQSK